MQNIISAYAVNNLCYISKQNMVPKGIVVHSTGANNPYLKRYVDAPEEVGINQYGNHWNVDKPGGRKVCVHAFIGYDNNKQIRVAEILPLDICCWGVGSGINGSYNYDPAYIQFEICEDGLNDKDYYSKAFSVAVEYCAYLCRKYGLSTNNIVGHCEAFKLGYGSNHSDPEHWMKIFGDNMECFRKRVFEVLKSNDERVENTDENTCIDSTIESGDLVSIAANAEYYNGVSVPSWVKAQNWYIKSISNGDRAIIDKNEQGTNNICSPINIKYLTLVKKSKQTTFSKTAETNKSNSFPYLVKVTSDCLYIRAGAGGSFTTTGSITDKGVYTIVEEKFGDDFTKWGKLKSGAGWISLDYVKKL